MGDIDPNHYICQITGEECRKWQPDRNKCFYDENNTLKYKVSLLFHRCLRRRSWFETKIK